MSQPAEGEEEKLPPGAAILAGLREQKNIQRWGLFGRVRKKKWGVAGGLVFCEGRKIRLLGFLFCVPSPQNYQMNPFLNVLRNPVFIGKMLLGFSTWSLNFFLFVNLIFFLIFLYFLKTSNINVDSIRKINDFKNDA